jgi:GTP-binding protein HflX
VTLNKIDLLGPAALRRTIQELRARYPDAVPISAQAQTGLEDLQRRLDDASRPDLVELELLVPYGEESTLVALRQIGGLERTEYEQAGTRAWGWAPRHALRRFERYCVAERARG